MPDWLEQALNLIGMGPDTPLEDQIVGGLTPNPLGAVSVFMKAGGGGKLARQAQTKATMDKLDEVLKTLELIGESSPEASQKVRDIYSKYPRTVGHFTDVAIEPEMSIQSIRAGIDPSKIEPGKSRLLVSPLTKTGKPREVPNVMTEELVHGAQNIGLKEHTKPLYDEASRLVGYDKIPHEISARQGAWRRAPVESVVDRILRRPPAPAGPKPPNIIDQLRALGIVQPGSQDFWSFIKGRR
jgi:hypothetical protein